MNSTEKTMDFNVYTDLHRKNEEYNIKLNLKNPVNSTVRELAIVTAGTVVRNTYRNLNKGVKNDKDLETLIGDTLNLYIGREVEEFEVDKVKIERLNKAIKR